MNQKNNKYKANIFKQMTNVVMSVILKYISFIFVSV